MSAAVASAGVTIDLHNQSENFNITGSGFADTITGGPGVTNVFFVGADTVDGGAGNDTIYISATSTHLNIATDAQIANVENIYAMPPSGVTIDLHNQSEGFTIYGTSNNDTITGGSGNDSITGESGNDSIDGGIGNDSIQGMFGNDIIDGGAGAGDTVIFSGNRADYTVALNGSTYTVVDNRAGSPNGTDAVTGVENFQFADGIFTSGASGTLDITAPTVTSVVYDGSNDGTLKTGETVTLVLTFSENLTVAGSTPSLTLDSGGTATFTGGSGSNQLLFTYTVEAGQNSADLAVTAFNLNGTTLKDAQGNDADTSGAVSNPDTTLVVDTTAPAAAVAITAIAEDTGTLGDFTTSDDTLIVSGTNGLLGADETVQVSSDGGSTWTDAWLAAPPGAMLIRSRTAAISPIRHGWWTAPATSATAPARPLHSMLARRPSRAPQLTIRPMPALEP